MRSGAACQTILFVVTEDWYFVSHRLQLAERLMQAGHRVILASRFTEHRGLIEGTGITCVPITMRRRGAGVLGELSAIRELRQLYRELSPDIVHHVAMKPVVFGGLASGGMPRLITVNAIAGHGFLYSSQSLQARVGRVVVQTLLRRLLGRERAWIIVQNADDARALRKAGIGNPKRLQLIGGAGVDLTQFPFAEKVGTTPVITFAGRMLHDKGVALLVEAARRLRAEGVAATFQLVGEPDTDNPRSHSSAELTAWQQEGIVTWLGRRNDMPSILAASDILCLPTTYGEGVPKILLEGSACGAAIVASDWPGCRDVVQHGETGLLVTPRSIDSLTDALRALCADPVLRRRMGEAGRRRVEQQFSIEAVTADTLRMYSEAVAA